MKWVLFKNAGWIALFWTAVIFILCATPGEYIPSEDWMELLSVDKLIHAGMFFMFTFFWFLFAIKKGITYWGFIMIVLAGIIYGGMLELMQARWFSNRSEDWKDFTANAFGCLVALLLLKRIKHFYLSQPT